MAKRSDGGGPGGIPHSSDASVAPWEKPRMPSNGPSSASVLRTKASDSATPRYLREIAGREPSSALNQPSIEPRSSASVSLRNSPVASKGASTKVNSATDLIALRTEPVRARKKSAFCA